MKTTDLYKRYMLARKYAWKALDTYGYDSDEYRAACIKQEKCWRDYRAAQRKRQGR